MVDYKELMRILSIPRLNGSSAERETREALIDWLNKNNIPFYLHNFRQYPYFFVSIGIWIILSRLLLAVSIWLRWGWPSFWIALIGLIGGLVDVALEIPLVTWIGMKRGKNILVEIEPEVANQEIVLSAHYDSKTELLDHHQRLFFIRSLPFGILISIVLGLLGPIDAGLLQINSSVETLSYIVGILLSLVLLFLSWGLGLNLSLGPLSPPSQGAVDNGSACAILLGLADRLTNGDIELENTKITLALFTGEEVNMQGSRAYTQARRWMLPTIALNLEIMAQDGDYVFWEKDGSSLRLMPTYEKVNKEVSDSVKKITGTPATPTGPVNSDGYSFLRAGIPTTVLGTYDKRLRDRGFHQPTDNINRVVMERLPEGVDILLDFIQKFDQADKQISDFTKSDSTKGKFNDPK